MDDTPEASGILRAIRNRKHGAKKAQVRHVVVRRYGIFFALLVPRLALNFSAVPRYATRPKWAFGLSQVCTKPCDVHFTVPKRRHLAQDAFDMTIVKTFKA